jgi:hypothetical protein
MTPYPFTEEDDAEETQIEMDLCVDTSDDD